MTRNTKREGPNDNTVPPLKILIVDDLQENRYLLEAMLSAQGYDNGISVQRHRGAGTLEKAAFRRHHIRSPDAENGRVPAHPHL